MRVSKTQQANNQRAIIAAAVELMTQHGFEATTMKQIARAANLGDATIYKYFPSKEKLVVGYFEQAVSDALALSQQANGWDDFTLQEHAQLLIDSFLEVLLADREFVAMARQLVERAPLLMLAHDMPGKPALQQAFLQMLDQAQASGEIPPCGFKSSLSALLADYVYGVVAYWLRDESDGFNDTTQMVDLSVGVLVLSLRSGLIDKLLELGGFVLRSQLARLMHNGTALTDLLQLARRGLKAAQR